MEIIDVPLAKTGKILRFHYRPDTTDIKAIEEVVKRNSYLGKDITILPDEQVADCGANIGAFAILAAAQGAHVRAIEPLPENLEILKMNVLLNGLTQSVDIIEGAVAEEPTEKSCKIYLPKRAGNKYRASILDDNKGKQFIEVPLLDFESTIGYETTGIKIDIEGAEKEILMAERNWDTTHFLVLEWHFDYHPNIAEFQRIMALQAKTFSNSRLSKMPAGVTEFNYFPSGKIQRFWNDPSLFPTTA